MGNKSKIEICTSTAYYGPLHTEKEKKDYLKYVPKHFGRLPLTGLERSMGFSNYTRSDG